MGLFDNSYSEPGGITNNDVNRSTTVPVPAATVKTNCNCNNDTDWSYLLLDLSDRRIARMANILQIIAALIVIISIIHHLFKSK